MNSIDDITHNTSRDQLMGPTFSTILNEFWTDFLQLFATPHTPTNVRPVHVISVYI